MKLIVQIPCFNEEHVLPETVADIAREIAGVDAVEVPIIDSGSTDRTVEAARKVSVDHDPHVCHLPAGVFFYLGMALALIAPAMPPLHSVSADSGHES